MLMIVSSLWPLWAKRSNWQSNSGRHALKEALLLANGWATATKYSQLFLSHRTKLVKQLDLDKDKPSLESLPGIQWSIQKDTFTFKLPVKGRVNMRGVILQFHLWHTGFSFTIYSQSQANPTEAVHADGMILFQRSFQGCDKKDHGAGSAERIWSGQVHEATMFWTCMDCWAASFLWHEWVSIWHCKLLETRK